MEKYLYIALFAPLLGSLFSSFFAMRKKAKIVGVVATSLVGVSMISSFVLLYFSGNNLNVHVKLIDWIGAGEINIPFGFLVDEISVIMMVVVTSVSFLVHLYSIGYMEKDSSFNRFFTYLSAFVFSMLVLVMSDNFAVLFIGWEGVGLCSWMLIGFWYERNSANFAANEAFIMNRIADLGMLIGIFVIYWYFGSLQYDVVFSGASLADNSVLSAIGILLFIGAMGKSAQFPLHTWLADAMEGPTPVSALIHAATMVTAGVYLVIRANPIYINIPDISFLIAGLGAFVAVFAAFMALVNRDLKRIIAYSTLSQLGYMFVAAGLGAYWIALFHLAAHAYFKSLLFLGAGNVMHAMNDRLDITKMGGLYKSLKFTAILMIIASVALSGIYPFAGFFSKDKILEVAFNEHAYILWSALFVGAGLTAFYSFRLISLVFFGKKEYEKDNIHPHEATPIMLLAMLPLGIMAIVAGFFESSFHKFTAKSLPDYIFRLSHDKAMLLIAGTLSIAVFGIGFALFMYIKKGGFQSSTQQTFFYKLFYNQYYIPQIYQNFIVVPFAFLANFAWTKIDEKVIDKSVDFIAKILQKSGKKSTNIFQDGNLSSMLCWMVFGVIVLLSVAFYYALKGA